MDNPLFYVDTASVYPPFKEGKYMEEFFLDACKDRCVSHDVDGRLYIPALWTNFQIEPWFSSRKDEMQQSLDRFISDHPCDKGYFTVVQYDDGPLLTLPQDTRVYGACHGDIQLPLIYEDTAQKLDRACRQDPKTFHEKKIMCSFVGTNTHPVRTACIQQLQGKEGFDITLRTHWSIQVNTDMQKVFIEKTLDSKFALAPRGYGRSSFRFFEIFQLGAVPVYVWDDIERLPYKELIDYSKICVSIHSSAIHTLPNILNNITQEKYDEMIQGYKNLQNIFSLEVMFSYITTRCITTTPKFSLCITTMDRYDTFLKDSLKAYVGFLEEGLVHEIVISDENGNDYEKIVAGYGHLLKDDDNSAGLRIYKNETVLGVFLNKMRACRYARHENIILMDSDNFADRDYFIEAERFVRTSVSSRTFILSPSRLLNTTLDYTRFCGAPITRNTIQRYLNDECFLTLLNTGNFVISKNIFDTLHHDLDTIKKISFYDVVYFHLLVFQQCNDIHLYVSPDLKYSHRVHADSGWLRYHHQGIDFYKNVLLPAFFALPQEQE